MLRWIGSLLDRLPVAQADSAPLTAVGVDLTPLPGGVPPVRMKREEVDIHLLRGRAAVEATFELENQSEARELEVGFPCLQAASNWAPPTGALSGFHVEVDGRAVPSVVRRLENRVFPFWMVWSQRFERGTTTRVTVRYWTALADYRGVSRAPFFYVLRTGRFWNGPIGEAIVRVHAAGVPLSAICEATPAGYVFEREAKRLVWTFRDLVPEQDICLLVSPLATRAASAGLELRDILELNVSRPPAGTPVVVGGYLRAELAPSRSGIREGLLLGERSRDLNVTIPESMPTYDEERDRDFVGVVVRTSSATTEKNLSLPVFFGRSVGILRLMSGKVAYDRDGRLVLDVDVIYHLTDVHLELSDPRFPWVRGPIEGPRPFHQIEKDCRWPETVRKASLERLK